MKKNKTSKNWINRQRRDIYVRKSKVEGYRSRAVYKLEEINQKFNEILVKKFGRSCRFSGSEEKMFFEKKFGHVKNIEGKAPVVSKRPETSLGVLCSSSSSSSSSTLLKNGNVETTNSRGEHGRPMPWLTQRTGKNVFCDRVGTDFNVFDCRGSFCELPFLQNSKIR